MKQEKYNDTIVKEDGSVELKKPDLLMGFTIRERCPEEGCGCILIRNVTGNVWCSNLECNYHIRGGKRFHLNPKERKVEKTQTVSKVSIKDIVKKFAENDKKK